MFSSDKTISRKTGRFPMFHSMTTRTGKRIPAGHQPLMKTCILSPLPPLIKKKTGKKTGKKTRGETEKKQKKTLPKEVLAAIDNYVHELFIGFE